MRNDIPQCVQLIGTSAHLEQVEAIHASMLQSSEGSFSEPEMDNLRVIIRLTVEFNHYLGLDCGHVFCREYMNESTFSGIDSFTSVTRAYQTLLDSAESTIHWGLLSESSWREAFASNFAQFMRESDFRNKCRLLLDLFKLQIIFAGVSYD